MENPIENNQAEFDISKILKRKVLEIVIHGEDLNQKELKVLENSKRFNCKNELLSSTNKEKKEEIKLKTDLDGRAAIFLLEEAGLNYDKLTFVKKGDWIPRSINIDTGERQGFSIEKDGTVFFDHHGSEKFEKDASTSATKIVYEVLVKNNILKRSEWLDNLVNYVTGIDNANYPLDKKFFINDWSKSFYGLQKVIPFETIFEYFRMGKTAGHPFTEQEIDTLEFKGRKGGKVLLKDTCKHQKELVDLNIKNISAAESIMRRSKIKTETPLLKRVIVNNVINKNEIELGFTAIRALGYDSYIILNENNGGFFISSTQPLKNIYEKVKEKYPNAKLIRGTMILQDQNNKKINQMDLLRTLDLISK